MRIKIALKCLSRYSKPNEGMAIKDNCVGLSLQSTVSSRRPITLARRPTMAGKNFCNALKWFNKQLQAANGRYGWDEVREGEGGVGRGQLADQLYR